MGETVKMSKRSRCIRCLVTDLAGLSELGLVGTDVEHNIPDHLSIYNRKKMALFPKR